MDASFSASSSTSPAASSLSATVAAALLPETRPRSGAALREAFLHYFEAQLGHKRLPSASLIPSNPTVLLTPAGMLPFVPIFLGIEPPPQPPRAVSVQKCARVSGKASDLQYVGRTPRHHTFFEMLGNFSFGDYFKRDVIPWAWTFVTQHLGIPESQLWVSVYLDDDESAAIWQEVAGVSPTRIVRRDKKDNFWGPPGPTGPCGPCTEIYVDRGPSYGGDAGDLDADRYVEIWNLVLMQFFQDDQGQLTPLEKKHVDTGMGLERLAMVLQGTDNTFETDLLYPILDKLAKTAGVAYKQSLDTDLALKVITDHLRCVTFAVTDGIVPSNEGRGYVIRMILRRAVRFGKQVLGFQQPFLYQHVAVVRDLYQTAYPELKAQYAHTVDVIKQEETRFYQTLERGTRLLDDVMAQQHAAGSRVIPGASVFKLYDTFGFPLELTEEIAHEQGFTLDIEGFEAAMAQQRERAREARKGGPILVRDQRYASILASHGATRFLGYDTLQAEATIQALLVDGELVESVSGTNQPFEAVLDQTPFYAESGGQVGDRGAFSSEVGPHGLTVVVQDTVKVGELFVHRCLFDQGAPLRVGDTILAQVEPIYRQLSAIHHTSTHLLQAALRSVLGSSVSQAGSHVCPEGARFDFTFPRALKADELQRVEARINRWILDNLPREVALLPLEEARQCGAIAMEGETYGETVRVVRYGATTQELCGGTHVERLGDIGLVKLISEGAIASGIRRIELVAGEQAYKRFKQSETTLQLLAERVKTPVRELPDKMDKLLDTLKQQERQLAQMEAQLATQQANALLSATLAARPASATGPVICLQAVTDVTAGQLKKMVEHLAAQLPSHVVLLAANMGGTAQFVCSVSADQQQTAGLSAGKLVQQAAQVCGGGGGGKPGFAQAGAKEATKIAEALAVVAAAVAASAAS